MFQRSFSVPSSARKDDATVPRAHLFKMVKEFEKLNADRDKTGTKFYVDRIDLPEKKKPRIFDSEHSSVSSMANQEIESFQLEMSITTSVIGEGRCGQVYKADYPKLGICAMKNYGNPRPKATVSQEIKQLAKLHHHPNIVQIFGCIKSNKPSQVAGYVMEYMNDGSVHDAIFHCKKNISVELTYSWLCQASRALSYLHGSLVVHSNVTLRRMLLTNSFKTLRLSSMDFHRHMDLNEEEKTVPEKYERGIKLKTKGTTRKFSQIWGNSRSSVRIPLPSDDIYSFGVVIWELITRRQLSDDRNQFLEQLDREDTFSEKELHSLVKRAANMDRMRRPSMLEISKFFEEKCRPHRQIRNPFEERLYSTVYETVNSLSCDKDSGIMSYIDESESDAFVSMVPQID